MATDRTHPFCPTHRIRRDPHVAHSVPITAGPEGVAAPYVKELVMRVGRRAYTREEWPDGAPSYRTGQHGFWYWHGHEFAGSIETVTVQFQAGEYCVVT